MNRIILHTCFFFTAFTACYSQVTPGVKLISSVRVDDDDFGNSVSIDGSYAVAGASNSLIMSDVGSATIFERNGSGNWNEIQRLAPSDLQSGDHFGEFVSMSGNYLAIGAPMADSIGPDSTLTDAGAVYIFEKNSGGVWQQVLKIWAEDARSDDHFGRVALSGKYLVVGSLNDFDGNGTNYKNAAGAAYVYERTDGGAWLPVQKLVASDRNTEDVFCIVSIDGFTKTIVVGAPYADTDVSGANALAYAGAAYVFKCDAGGNWNQTQKITASVRHFAAEFGYSVSVNGEHILVGALYEGMDQNDQNDMGSTGAAYLFKNNGSGMYSQVKKLVAYDRHQGDHFGNSVSLSGSYALVGAYEANTDENSGNFLIGPGAAYLYENSGTAWSLKKKLVAPDRNANDEFGTSVAISGAQLIVGAHGEDDNATDPTTGRRGAAYIFTILNPLGTEENSLVSVDVYPNPTSGKLSIKSDASFGELTLTLYDVTGKLLNETRISNSGVISYDMNQPEGMYFLEISADGFSEVKRIVVR